MNKNIKNFSFALGAAITISACQNSNDNARPEQKDSMAAVAVEAVIYAPDAAFAVAEVSAAAADVGVEAAGAGIEAAGGLLEGLLEFIGGLFS